MNGFLIAAIAIIAVIAALVIYKRRVADGERAEALQSLAPMLGFSLEARPMKLGESGIDATLLAFPLFKHGGDRRVRNLMRARRLDGEDLVFDYRYTVSSGKSSHLVEQTVAAFSRRGARLPSFRMSPEDVLAKLGHLFGAQDIDFEHNVEFSKSYVLKGEDPDAVRACFEREAVSYFADRPGWSVEGGGECVMVYRSSRREQPETLREWVEETRRLARVFGLR